jgi:hypothetical protein
MNVERYHAYVKTVLDNEPVPPFSMDLTKNIEEEDKLRNPEVAKMIKQLSAAKYGRDRAEVEEEINQRSNL